MNFPAKRHGSFRGVFIFSLLLQKKTMKTPTLLLLLAATVSGCISLDGLGRGPSRTDSERNDHPSSDERTPDLPGPAATTDTTLYYTAVRFPDSYDWQRDTAYGKVGFELLLCREGTTLLTLPNGPEAPFCADPDRHHILDGHLYTERMLANETLIGRDGVELFRFDGREFLLGLLQDGEDLHTVSRPVSGKGFSYRVNGKPLLTRSDGSVFGSLTDPSYGPGGALYRNDGQVAFCFRSGYVTTAAHYLARDGKEIHLDNILPGRTVLDLKQHGDQTLILYPSFMRNVMYEGRIWPGEHGYAVTGRFSDGTGGYIQGLIESSGLSDMRPVCREENAVMYHSAEETCAVYFSQDGTVRWNMLEGGGAGSSGEPCHFFSGACAALAGSRFAIALTPKDIHRPPRILNGSRTLDTGIYGYVSSVALEISRPN